MNRVKLIALVASLTLAILVIFSCSSSGNNGQDVDSLPPPISWEDPCSSVGSYECESVFNPSTHFCYDGNVYSKCSCNEYNPTNQMCQGGNVVAITVCGTGSTYYNPATERCCGNSKYTPATKFCFDDKIYDRCNGMEYNPTTHICQSSVANPAKCNGIQYNPLEQRCQNNVIETKCGISYYNPATQFCLDDKPYSLCDGVQYNPKGQTCYNKIVVTACNGPYYNPSTHFCHNGSIVGKCGGNEYTPSTQYCVDDVVKTSKGEFVDPRNDKTYKYVTIGTQTWMAEDLNYNKSGYECTTDACKTYGRLYDWAAAMDICPEGWHLPSKAEWDILSDFVDGRYDIRGDITTNLNGKHLKATSGWNGLLDTYGFTALPSRSDHLVGGIGGWWSASEYDNGLRAYDIYMASNYEYSYWDDDDDRKNILLSVRCVQD
jgi:uncharacterized protein (TIGR02145 family)